MKQTTRVAIGCVLACLLAGCATSYQSTGLTGGYSDTQLSQDVFRIHFTGNAWTSSERSQDLCMLRAAEITLQKGFAHFVVMDEADRLVYGSGPYNTILTRPVNALQIKCFKSKPEGLVSYDAAFLQQTLKQKYSIAN